MRKVTKKSDMCKKSGKFPIPDFARRRDAAVVTQLRHNPRSATRHAATAPHHTGRNGSTACRKKFVSLRNMTDERPYKIEVTSSYDEFWRYNVALMCGCFDAADQRTGFASTEDTVAEVGAHLKTPPADYPTRRRTRLEAPACDHLILYLYVIPHTLPAGNDTTETRPFSLHLHITAPDGTESKQTFRINQWSGASIELRIPNQSAR